MELHCRRTGNTYSRQQKVAVTALDTLAVLRNVLSGVTATCRIGRKDEEIEIRRRENHRFHVPGVKMVLTLLEAVR